jgi:hypothetical protein
VSPLLLKRGHCLGGTLTEVSIQSGSRHIINSGVVDYGGLHTVVNHQSHSAKPFGILRDLAPLADHSDMGRAISMFFFAFASFDRIVLEQKARE